MNYIILFKKQTTRAKVWFDLVNYMIVFVSKLFVLLC